MIKKLLLTLLFSAISAHASETIRIIVPYAAGGNTDLEPRVASDSEVKEAKKNAEPANEVEPKGASDKK